ncbi:hypothetical protein FKR81_07340 [Lentzea tibetensis]|uniref:ABC-2 type transport system permease protein n=1 Tax=Lentzea tibetensis TaxID=2591470 RepID=A0A563EYU8_9PSEU|nr:hypothetical protein [Lentzea tibetensis]TWP52917.1 hypothetical protein FKR81_07340 [Lentzea tibetensis]
MTLLAVERIKLFSTRSPWWCAALALVITVGITALIAANTSTEFPLTVGVTQAFYTFGMYVVLVMAALAITTEYRFSTIRATFLAVPNRISALLAKTVVVSLLAGVIGELVAFGSWGISKLIKPDVNIAINTAQEWRNVAGVGAVFFVGAIFAIAIGTLLRHTAGAVALLLVWALVVESLVGIIPKIGDDIQRWMPFVNGNRFLTAGTEPFPGEPVINYPFGAWGSLGYFAAISVGLLIVAFVVAKRRDA